MKIIYTLFFTCLLVFSCEKKPTKKEVTTTKKKDSIDSIIDIRKKLQEKNFELNSNKKDDKLDVIIFTVQIAALHNPTSNKKELKSADVYKEGDFTKYRLGHFSTYKEAKSYRKKIINKYPDAFVQALKNDKPIHISKALE